MLRASMDPTRRTLLFGATAAGGAVFGASAWADPPAYVRSVVVQPSGRTVRVIIVGMDRLPPARTFFLTDPERFVVDLPNTRLLLPQGGQGPGGGLVRRYRYAPRPGGAARVVFDLDAPARVVRRELGVQTSELSFDLAPAGYYGGPVYQPGNGNAVRRTIVVDPGHGGRDPGARGPRGIREKEVALDIALQLRDVLESRGNYRVALTRDADHYIELADRVRFARAQGADLFISIHADSHADPTFQGASVYTISEHGAARAQGLMSAQNWDLDLGDAPPQGPTRDVLVDLYQRETTNRSGQFAQLLIQRLGEVTRLLRNTHRSASFFVLLTPDVPAVLIETGFLSNFEDERRLSDPLARQALAGAMAAAVDEYFGVATLQRRA